MKKNALLGVFALMFAVATAFATTMRSTQPVYYFLDEDDKTTGCTRWEEEINCVVGDENCREITPDGDRQLYNEGCSQTLERQPGF